jgi:hypothetical protein
MAGIGFLQSLGIIAICAAVMVMVGRMLRMPAIVVYLLCGILVGPVMGWVGVEQGLDLVSETGIALLLFLVGLELSIGKVRDVGKVALIAGFMQVVLTAGLVFLLAKVLGFGLVPSLFLGAALTFSSTVVVVKLSNRVRGFVGSGCGGDCAADISCGIFRRCWAIGFCCGWKGIVESVRRDGGVVGRGDDCLEIHFTETVQMGGEIT